MSTEILRRMGRPDQQASEDLVRHIVDTATRLFIDQGYAATSIEQIAAAAGSGKQTIYRRFISKEVLFTEVINRQGQRLMELAEAGASSAGRPMEELKAVGRRLFDFVLQPDMISLHRILLAETRRFPELGEYVLDNCMSPFRELLNRLLRAAGEAGQVDARDVETTQSVMLGLLTGWPSQQAMLGRRVLTTPAERDVYFEAAWSVFERGAAPTDQRAI